jgi:peptidoglycan/LPS O-acetylase OafA/YrhL
VYPSLPALDGLRFYSFAAVLVSHALVQSGGGVPLQKLGGFGVDVFFALSGFLVTWRLHLEQDQTGTISLRAFFKRRTLRIWPMYFTAVAVAFALIAVFGDRYLRAFGAADFRVDEQWWRYLLFVSNWSHAPQPSSLDVLWSVCIEEHFYLVVPFFILLLKYESVAVFTAVAGVAALIPGIHTDPWARETHLRMLPIVCGAILGSLQAADPKIIWRFVQRHRRIFVPLLCVATIGFCSVLPTYGGILSLVFFPSSIVAAVIACGWVMLAVVQGEGGRDVDATGDGAPVRAPWLNSLLVRDLGRRTYEAYVLHMYAVAISWTVARQIVKSSPWQGLLRLALAAPTAFLLAACARVLITGPIERLSRRNQTTPDDARR